MTKLIRAAAPVAAFALPVDVHTAARTLVEPPNTPEMSWSGRW